MIWYRRCGPAFFAFSLLFLTATRVCAHTPDMSASLIVPEGRHGFRIELGLLRAEIERMLLERQVALDPAASPLQKKSTIDAFIQARVMLQNAEGKSCASQVITSEAATSQGGTSQAGATDAKPEDDQDIKTVLRFDCSQLNGAIFYNPYKLIATQGPRARQVVTIEEPDGLGALGKNAASRELLIAFGDAPLDLTHVEAGLWPMIVKFFEAGIEHIVTGYDHLCFVLALILWANRVWPVVKIVTAFTISHSITLTLAGLGLVNIPSQWVEIAIAASIVFVALENFFFHSVAGRWKVAFAFGFIHGFGLASGLTELGIPQHAIVPALASFNLGVEFGQIGVVLIAMPLLALFDRYVSHGHRSTRLVYLLSAIIAGFGVYWMLVRLGVWPG